MPSTLSDVGLHLRESLITGPARKTPISSRSHLEGVRREEEASEYEREAPGKHIHASGGSVRRRLHTRRHTSGTHREASGHLEASAKHPGRHSETNVKRLAWE